MSEFRVAKLEALLARVLERGAARGGPMVLTPSPFEPAPSSMHHAATTPPPPPVAVPAVSIPREPLPAPDLQESTHVSARAWGPELVPAAAESHARITTANRAPEPVSEAAPGLPPQVESEDAPVSSERTVDPSYEADPDPASAPPESTRQLATNPPQPRLSVAPDSAARSVQHPVVTRGSLPPDANVVVEFEGQVAAPASRSVGDLLDATFAL